MMHMKTVLKKTDWKFPSYTSSQISEKSGNFRALNNWLVYSALLKHDNQGSVHNILTSVPNKRMDSKSRILSNKIVAGNIINT